MSEALSVAGEGAAVFRRLPEPAPHRLFFRRPAQHAKPWYKFAFARTALEYGLAAIGLGRGDALLVPDLICDSVLEPLDDLGIEPSYYPVPASLHPDWNELERRLTANTRALLVVHYFGQPQPLAGSIEFCRTHSLVLIEDNAHGFGGTFEGRQLGTFGAVGISSPRKSFPLLNGAYLHLAHDPVEPLPVLPVEPFESSRAKQCAKRWIKRIPPVGAAVELHKRRREGRRRSGSPPMYGSQNAYRTPPIERHYGMDACTDAFLRGQDIDRIRLLRRRIYELWQEWSEMHGLTPVFPSLSPGAVPLVFPAYTDSAAGSLAWFERGHRAGVDIHSWPTLPQAIVEEDAGAMRLWERLVCFPIHHEMDPALLRGRLRDL